MGLKKYIIFGALFLIAMGVGIYSYTGDYYAMPLRV